MGVTLLERWEESEGGRRGGVVEGVVERRWVKERKLEKQGGRGTGTKRGKGRFGEANVLRIIRRNKN